MNINDRLYRGEQQSTTNKTNGTRKDSRYKFTRYQTNFESSKESATSSSEMKKKFSFLSAAKTVGECADFRNITYFGKSSNIES